MEKQHDIIYGCNLKQSVVVMLTAKIMTRINTRTWIMWHVMDKRGYDIVWQSSGEEEIIYGFEVVG